MKQNKKIGVGGWATYGHLPAVKIVESIEVVAVSSRTKAKPKNLP